MIRWSAILAAMSAVLGCAVSADYAGTQYQCPDGITCPSGFECIDFQCVDNVGFGEPDGGAEVEMVLIPAGSFMMGCSEGQRDCELNEQPAHTVTLSAFEIDRTEVTRADYAACVADGVCAPAGGPKPTDLRLPVTRVSWFDADAHCKWANKRLPTEAEWEYAARRPTASTYPWGESNANCQLANYLPCAVGAPKPVGTSRNGATVDGLQDMAGNVNEWVADTYEADYYQRSETTNPPGPATGPERSVRGGSYDDEDVELMTYERDSEMADEREDPGLGFRCAR